MLIVAEKPKDGRDKAKDKDVDNDLEREHQEISYYNITCYDITPNVYVNHVTIWAP